MAHVRSLMYLDSDVTISVHLCHGRCSAGTGGREPADNQEAQRRVYSLRPEPLTEVDEWLGRYRALWQQRLEALHTEVARGKRERRSTR